MTTPPTPTPIMLTDEMREAINGALGNGTPVLEDGKRAIQCVHCDQPYERVRRTEA